MERYEDRKLFHAAFEINFLTTRDVRAEEAHSHIHTLNIPFTRTTHAHPEVMAAHVNTLMSNAWDVNFDRIQKTKLMHGQ